MLEESDLPFLEKFCNECKILGLNNNKDFEAIKLEKMVMPYGQYFVGWDRNSNKIWNLAGIHHLPEISNNTWRCLFRGAQLPGYTIGTSKNFLKISYHWRYFLLYQIDFILSTCPCAEFVISTNIDNISAGRSSQLNATIMPLLAKHDLVTLYRENIDLFYVKQNIWKIDILQLRKALELINRS